MTYLQFFIAMMLVNLFPSAQGPLCDALMLAEMRGDLSNYGKLRLLGFARFHRRRDGRGLLPRLVRRGGAAGIYLRHSGTGIFASLRIRESVNVARAHDLPPLLHVLRKPEVGAFFLSAALMCGAHMALYAFYSLYLERAGYSKPLIGAMWALGVVAEVAFFYFQSHLFGRFGARRVMMFAFGAAVLRFAVTGAAPDLLWVMVAAQLLHAFTFAAHHSACVMTMQRWFSGALQASGQALYMSVAYGLGCSVGGLALTYCWDRIGPQQMFHVAAAMTLAGAAAAWVSFRLQERANG